MLTNSRKNTHGIMIKLQENKKSNDSIFVWNYQNFVTYILNLF